jgi:hypothetical protein
VREYCCPAIKAPTNIKAIKLVLTRECKFTFPPMTVVSLDGWT